MLDNDIRELMLYRQQMAFEHLTSAELLFQNGQYKDSIGRSYYAMFSAVRSLLALDYSDFAKHAGVISYFQKEYIKTGKLEVKYSKYLSQAFQIRNNVDYADFFIVSKEDAQLQMERARELCLKIKEYCENAE